MRVSPTTNPSCSWSCWAAAARPQRSTWPGGSWAAEVGRVLTGNGITVYGTGAYSLIGGDELSDTERGALLELCRQRLDAFRELRDEEVFAHRRRHRSPISGSVTYRAPARARGRCECCGAHEHQRTLQVDHNIPRNQGGSDAISNLQALCFRCNAGKRDGCLPTQEGAPTSAVCRPATATAKRAACSARWRAAAGCCWRTNWRSASPMPTR
ncbi:HNH endonuclease [Cyanobium sp. N5-Cardenillas]|nr:HNH endonuclease [Cyanobium sp. N5-Cardenillas]